VAKGQVVEPQSAAQICQTSHSLQIVNRGEGCIFC
jgi:hypothetical protein